MSVEGVEAAALSLASLMTEEALFKRNERPSPWTTATSQTLDSGARQTRGAMSEAEFSELVGSAENLVVPRRSAHSQTFSLKPKDTLRWHLYVRSNGLTLTIKKRQMADGGATETIFVKDEVTKGVAVVGDYRNSGDETIQLVADFDNSKSRFLATTVIFGFSTQQGPMTRPPPLMLQQPKGGFALVQLSDIQDPSDDDDSDDQGDDSPSSSNDNNNENSVQHDDENASIMDVISL